MRAGMLALMTPVMTSTLGPLGGHDAMDARRARHLRDARDGHFHVRRRHQHQVGQLVDDDHDVAELLRDDDVLVARHDDFLVHLDGEAVGARLDLFLLGRQRQLRLARRAAACSWAAR